jgi:magnesium transporter
MAEKREILRGKVREYLEREDRESLRKMFEEMHPEDISSLLDASEEEERKIIFDLLDIEEAAVVLSEVESVTRPKLLEELEDARLSDILEVMPPDNATDILGELFEEKRKKILQLMEEEESREVRKLLKYGKDTAGGIMTPEFVQLNENLSANEAIKKLRTIPLDRSGFYIYVTDEEKHLKGVLRLRKLIAAAGETLLKNIMNPDLISVKTNIDQEEVANLVERYNLLAIPVVDEENKLVGIVTGRGGHRGYLQDGGNR